MGSNGVYCYSPIDSASGEIRLLHVQNGPKTADIVCHFQHVRLSPKPYYIALSYCWGSSQERAVIWLEGSLFRVTQSVDEALRALRKNKTGIRQENRHLDCDEVARAEHLVIWIDAICIDQANLNERGAQVRIMRAIYQGATQTILWLGGSNEEAIIVEQMISKLQLEIASELGIDPSLRTENLREMIVGYKLEHGLKFYPSTPPSKFLPPFESSAWDCLASFYAHPWFTRMWVIQEVGVSQYPVFAYGSRRLNWEVVAYIASWLAAVSIEDRSRRDGFARVTNPMIMLGYSKGKFRISGLLRLTRVFKSTDRRDKIFALLGISREGSEQQPLPSALVPNYHLTVQEIYTDSTRHLLEAEGISHIFAQVAHACDDGFPSWVPRWDLPCPTLRFRETPAFNASGNEHQFVQQFKDRDSLRLKGFRFETVQFISNIFDGDLDFLGSETFYMKGPYPNGEDILTAIRLTMVADRTSRDNPAAVDPNHESDFAAFIVRYENSLYQSLSIDQQVKFGRLYAFDATDDGQRYRNAMQFATRARRFFITTKGYFGLGPSYMALEDRLCILLGGETPYILRQRNGFQIFIGECYVHGLM